MSLPLLDQLFGNGIQWGSFFLNNGESFHSNDVFNQDQDILYPSIPSITWAPSTISDSSDQLTIQPCLTSPCIMNNLHSDITWDASFYSTQTHPFHVSSDSELCHDSTACLSSDPMLADIESVPSPLAISNNPVDPWKECIEKDVSSPILEHGPIPTKTTSTTPPKRKRMENDWILFKKYYTEKVKSERPLDIKKGDLSAKAVRNAWRAASKQVKSEIQKAVVRKRIMKSLASIENEYDKYNTSA